MCWPCRKRKDGFEKWFLLILFGSLMIIYNRKIINFIIFTINTNFNSIYHGTYVFDWHGFYLKLRSSVYYLYRHSNEFGDIVHCFCPAWCYDPNVDGANFTMANNQTEATVTCAQGYVDQSGATVQNLACVNGSWEPIAKDCLIRK